MVIKLRLQSQLLSMLIHSSWVGDSSSLVSDTLASEFKLQ